MYEECLKTPSSDKNYETVGIIFPITNSQKGREEKRKKGFCPNRLRWREHFRPRRLRNFQPRPSVRLRLPACQEEGEEGRKSVITDYKSPKLGGGREEESAADKGEGGGNSAMSKNKGV